MASLRLPALSCRSGLSGLGLGLVVALVMGGSPARAQTSRSILVEVNATTSATSPRITLDWPAVTDVTGNPTTRQLYRREKGAASWTSLTNLNSAATSYADTTALAGVTYEYSLSFNRTTTPTKVHGGIAAGYNVPLAGSRGNVLLVVDETMATPLTTELEQLKDNLIADGWRVYRLDTPREQYPNSSTNPADYAPRTAERAALRAAIKSYHDLAPGANWALLLIGHVPVTYSGHMNPDGHSEHVGAWPTDSYYADMDGTWTDSSVNVSVGGSRPETINVPGDGKFDQSILPGNGVEMQVGRIDLYNMASATPAEINAFPPAERETELLRQYLVRNDRFRHVIAPYDNVARRLIVDDDFFEYRDGEAFAGSGWRAGINLFGRAPGQVDKLDWFGTLQTTPMLMAYGCGNGTYTSAQNVGMTSNFATLHSKAVFTMLFGSYFGDWDNANAFLRAPLAGTPDSLGLTNIWSGRPWVHLNHMALGETIGYGVRYTQNVPSQTGGWFQNPYPPAAPQVFFYRWIHLGLMGDPTLRLHSMRPPTDVMASTTATTVELSWTASADATEGYHVYRAESTAGPFTRLTGVTATGAIPTGTPQMDLTYTDASVVSGLEYTYLVKAVRMEETPSGNYANQSLGAAATILYEHPSAPEAPGSFAAMPGSAAGEIDLSWSEVPGVDSYEIERSLLPDEGFANIETLTAPASAYTDTGLVAGTTYYYRVRGLDLPYNTAYSEASSEPFLPGGLPGWRYVHFMTTDNTGDAANDADPDDDARPNLEEYATGGDPHVPFDQPAITAQVQLVEGQPRLTLTFIHNKAATDLDLTVLVGNSIDDPAPAGLDPLLAGNQLEVQDETPAPGLETITVKDTQDVTAASERYMRLEIEETGP